MSTGAAPPIERDRPRRSRPDVLRVLVVTNMFPREDDPGYGTFVERQVAQLRRLGHHVDVLVIDGYRSKAAYLSAVWRVRKRCRENRYDVVHAHYGLSAVAARFTGDTPLVITLHGSDALQGWLQPALSRVACRRAAAVIAVSEEIASRFSGVIIPCGVDLDVFRPLPRSEARERLGLAATSRYVLFPFDPAREVKRYDLAEAAVDLVATRRPDVRMLVAHGIDPREMPVYHNAADVMILCSDREGSPASVKEALACNTPVVATDVGSVREVLAGIDGTVICSADPRALAEGLEAALFTSSPSPFDGRTAMSRYDNARIAGEIVDLYRTVIARRRNRDVHSG